MFFTLTIFIGYFLQFLVLHLKNTTGFIRKDQHTQHCQRHKKYRQLLFCQLFTEQGSEYAKNGGHPVDSWVKKYAWQENGQMQDDHIVQRKRNTADFRNTPLFSTESAFLEFL